MIDADFHGRAPGPRRAGRGHFDDVGAVSQLRRRRRITAAIQMGPPISVIEARRSCRDDARRARRPLTLIAGDIMPAS